MDDDGVTFPEIDGRRSTSATGRAVAADAVRDVDPGLARAIMAEQDWRRGYLDHYRDLTFRAAARPGAALAISAAGLDSVHERFRFRRDGEDLPLRETVRAGLEEARRRPALFTVTVAGSGPAVAPGLSVPYHGARLTGDALRRRLDRWLADGVAEPSFAAAIEAVQAEPEQLDLRGLTVVVLGAGAELGPVVSLLRWGAHVVAVDLPGYPTWRRLIDTARTSPGRLSIPVRHWLPDGATDDEIATAAGVDVIAETPQLFGWLAELQGPFTLGNYVYADGAVHVRASVAIDALTAELTRLRPDLSLAFLATPTDVFCVPSEAMEDSRRRYAQRSWARRLGGLGTAGRLFAPNYEGPITLSDGRPAGLNDSMVPQQGPNYALAKRVQRWRALHERAAGRLVSLNIAPATRTRSVLRNRLLAAGYSGAHQFGVEVFDPSTSNTLMAALLAHDLRDPLAAANPAVPQGHPLELFWSQAIHGGLWRTPFAPRSVLGAAVVLGMVQRGA
ncbi:MAG TPA: hypothetical protein VFP72_01740 [Kineosporiaceae bacterium]|nr:hypothetical protein [Kineosporiaceae bacterium]